MRTRIANLLAHFVIKHAAVGVLQQAFISQGYKLTIKLESKKW